MRHLLCCLVLLASSTVHAQPKIEEGEDPRRPSIRLPMSAEPVLPVAVTELREDAFFVIETEMKCIVMASRNGYVQVTDDVGPLRMRGRFADGTRIETRMFTGKYLYFIDAIAAGTVEVFVVPVGATDESAVIRRTLNVVMGAQPPPTPIIPKPDPGPPPPVAPDPPKPQDVFGMAVLTAPSVRAHIPAEKRVACAGLSANHSMIAARIAAKELTTFAEVNAALKTANQATAGDDLALWSVVIKEGNAHMNELVKVGELDTKNMEHLRQVFMEIAAGLLAAGN